MRRIGSMIIFHLSKLWTAEFFILAQFPDQKSAKSLWLIQWIAIMLAAVKSRYSRWYCGQIRKVQSLSAVNVWRDLSAARVWRVSNISPPETTTGHQPRGQLPRAWPSCETRQTNGWTYSHYGPFATKLRKLLWNLCWEVFTWVPASLRTK